MNHEQPVRAGEGPRVLVAPLDWGLGHATRCIPVIYEMLNQGISVWLAGEGAQGILLKEEFPDLPFLDLPGYRVKYGKSPFSLVKNLLFQAPAIVNAIRNEHRWLKTAVEKYRFSGVVSDNRFGLYHKSIPSVFMTHQLTIKSPLGRWNEKLLQKINYRYINRFHECWIPDEKNENGLAGELSHPAKQPSVPMYYVGVLSRLKRESTPEKKGHLFISISGPEPQRSILEDMIIRDIGNYNGTATIARGLPDSAKLIPSTNDIRFFNHLPSEEFSREMAIAEFVICRSGYSSVMDIVTLNKKSILIPTPGQTEQEYLAKYLREKGTFFSMEQKDFSLPVALQKARSFQYNMHPGNEERNLKTVIGSFLSKLKS